MRTDYRPGPKAFERWQKLVGSLVTLGWHRSVVAFQRITTEQLNCVVSVAAHGEGRIEIMGDFSLPETPVEVENLFGEVFVLLFHFWASEASVHHVVVLHPRHGILLGYFPVPYYSNTFDISPLGVEF